MAAGATAQPENLSEFSRLSGIVWDPKAAFRDIAARPRWWPPLVLTIALSLVFSYMFTQRVGWERFFRQQVETNSRMQNMPADQREQAVSMQVRFAPFGAYGFSLVGFPVMAVITAGVFLLIFRTALGAALSFRQVFAVVCYSWVPTFFSTIMALAVMLLKDPEQFDLQNPTLTNAGAFLDPLNSAKWLYSLATSIDIFTFWMLALLATGLSVAARKISWSTSLTCVAGTWAVYVLIKVGWAAMFG